MEAVLLYLVLWPQCSLTRELPWDTAFSLMLDASFWAREYDEGFLTFDYENC